MEITGQDIIDRIAERLKYEGKLMYDSAILGKLRELTRGEFFELTQFGNVVQWHNATVNRRTEENERR